MRYSTTVGVDLAKDVIQISVVSARGKELCNRSLTRKKFTEFLGKHKPSFVAFESCATAHYWARVAQRHGYKARIIPAKAVAPFRQGHKTDSNDALAVAEAACRPNIKEAPMKTVEQQGLQAIQRSCELLNQECTALSNHLCGLLMELGIVIPQGFASLLRALPEVLEDGDIELPDLYRPTLHRMYTRLLELREDIKAMTKEVELLVNCAPGLQSSDGTGRHRPDRCAVTVCRDGLRYGIQERPRVCCLPWPDATAVQQRRQDQYRGAEQEGRQPQAPRSTDSRRTRLYLPTQGTQERQRPLAERPDLAQWT